MQEQDKKMNKVKKGWLAVQVGLEDEDGDFRRFSIPISYLYHPLFQNLLDRAREVYGYNTAGPLMLPCSVDDFLHLRWRVEKETGSGGGGGGGGGYGGGRHHHHHHRPVASSFSFHSC